MKQYGDWYMLQLIGKNVDGHYFNYFLVELSNALKEGWKYTSGLEELDEDEVNKALLAWKSLKHNKKRKSIMTGAGQGTDIKIPSLQEFL